jgi:hypothetical protein
MSKWHRMMRDERGVALVTVLFIGAVMTVTVSAAAFIAVGEFRASNRDRGATTALALSEAGIDRTIQWIRSNKVPWRFIALSGCSSVGTVGGVSYTTITLNGQIGTGTYSTTITRADGCSPLPTSVPSPRVAQQLVLSSTGCTDNAAGVACPTGSSKRLVEQAVAVTSRTLPVGMTATTGMDVRGSPSFQNMIVVTRGIISSRKHMSVTGTDPYYKKSDFYPCIGGKTAGAFQCFTAGAANDTAMPASVHSTDRIFTNPNGGDAHPPSPNCTYPWDGSALGTTITGTACGLAYPNRPPTALFTEADADRITNTPRLTEEDHLYFKNVAQQSGLYCSNYGAAGSSCTRAGAAATVTGDIDTADVTGLGGFYVVYVEYPSGSDPQRNMLGWNVAAPAGTNPCSSTAATGSMVVVIVRNGGLETKSSFIGAIFAEDGRYETGANASFEGTVAAQFIRTRGSPNLCNSQRWLDSMPGIFITVAPLQWSEVDR